MIVLWIILWVLAAILAVLFGLILLVVLLAAIPVRYTIKAKQDKGTDFFVRVTYLFRIFSVKIFYRNGAQKIDFRIFGIRVGARKRKKPPATREKRNVRSDKKKIPAQKSEEKQAFNITNLYAVLTELQVKTIIRPVYSTIRKCLRILRPYYIDVSGVIGFGCPFSTGIFFAAYESVAVVCNFRDKVRITGDFDTDEMVVSLNAEVRGKISALRMAIPVIQLILKKPVRKIIKDLL